MPSFLRDIPHAQLPKTFLDVLVILDRLKIKYVWIDSLCIIQNEPSLDDWKREAPQMAEVYSNSILNIAATGARDSSQGLFFPHSDASRRFPEICLEWSYRENNIIRYTMIDYFYWKKLMTNEPLLKRAWVVQERLLAPRVLHFGSEQLFWECKEHQASEDFPDGGLLPLIKPEHGSLFKYTGNDILQLLNSTHPNPAHAVWQRALSVYTSCALTMPSDKLIALAGIAKELNAELSTDYFAGLWRRWLPTEMLWYVDTITASQQPTAYRAPSFSWASIDGAIVPGSWQEDAILVNILEASAQREPMNPFGAVESGHVRLQGTLKRASVCLKSNEMPVGRNAHARLPTERPELIIGTKYTDQLVPPQRWLLTLEDIHAPTNIEPTWKTYGRTVYRDMSFFQKPDEITNADVTEPEPELAKESFTMEGANVYLDVELFHGAEDLRRQVFVILFTAPSTMHSAIRGLILEPTGHVMGEYRRLGLFTTSHNTLMNVLSVPHQSEGNIPCEQYDSKAHKHTFTII
jgi:hypothetical protein